MRPASDVYVFRPAEELEVGEKPAPKPRDPEDGAVDEAPPAEAPEWEPAPPEPQRGPVDYVQIQAEAIMAAARQEAEAYREQAREDFEKELDQLREDARREGYDRGFAEGMASAMREGKAQREEMARDQIKAIEDFLEAAAYARDRAMDQSKEELKMLALAIAEKVIRISLKGSGDILRRMVETAIEKHKRCEWAHIYVADCDVKGSANTIPELTAALRGVSSRVRVIPMADDESGTCIIEMPDEILDASVSTQLGNIRNVLENASLDDGKL